MPERIRGRLAGARGWLIPAALLALTPKCILCVLAYADIGAALGLGGTELCGATGDTAGWTTWLSAGAGAAILIGLFLRSPPRTPL